MKIAVIGASPIPFGIGGIENLLWGLCDTINQCTPHQAELIKLPVLEDNFWNIIDSYYTFYTLDLSHFDTVICAKYPAWMVQHKNIVYYIAHRLRGLYDTYHFLNLPTEVQKGNSHIDALLHYMDAYPLPTNLNDFFFMLFQLKEVYIPSSYFDFPGAFIRRLIHYMDNFGMGKNNPHTFYCISNTVKKRTEYFPTLLPNANVQTIYPPPILKDFRQGEYRHIFFASRLDSPKRVDMLIEAMKHVKSDIKLYIAGTGPQEELLKVQAANDKRIIFLGFINDSQMEDYYANSLVIPYFPYEEDYGLITIEAMMYKKPVITTFDAGGPTEFVEDGKTGFCVNFFAPEIGAKIDYFALNPLEAVRMGNLAYQKVKSITWENTIQQLLGEPVITPKRTIGKTYTTSINTLTHQIDKQEAQTFVGGVNNVARKKITIATTYPIYPPLNGGQSRIFNLYKHVAQYHDIEIVTLTNPEQPAFEGFIAKNMKEIRIPKTFVHQQEEWNKYEQYVKIPITDIAMLALWEHTPEYKKALDSSMANSDIIIISHPYTLRAILNEGIKDKFIIYEAHNIESCMKIEMLSSQTSQKQQELVQLVYDAEKECCEISNWIMVCSQEDKQTLHKIYNCPLEKISVVPNGVDCSQIQFTDINQRLFKKSELGLVHEKLGVFIGSWHTPNLEACEQIFKIAKLCPTVKFLLMGNQCQYFDSKNLQKNIPNNVGMLGLVSSEQKDNVFKHVDFALNPMESGSGTNLKMFDYMASGIPIITTSFGARGVDNVDKNNGFHIVEINQMAETIQNFDTSKNTTLVENARRIAEEQFDWSVIAVGILEKIGNAISPINSLDNKNICQCSCSTNVKNTKSTLDETVAITNPINTKKFLEKWIASGEPINYEDILEEQYTKLIKPSDTVIDIGGHEGRHLRKFIQLVGDSGKCIAFEPLKSKYKFLKKTFPNVDIRHMALSDNVGVVDFYENITHPEESGLRQRIYNNAENTITTTKVKVSTLDVELAELTSLSYIKIDAEGAEISILNGGTSIINKFRPIISVEYGFPSYSVYGLTKASLYGFCKNVNYFITDIYGNLIPTLNIWESLCDSVYWDYFLVPQEKLDMFWENV